MTDGDQLARDLTKLIQAGPRQGRLDDAPARSGIAAQSGIATHAAASGGGGGGDATESAASARTYHATSYVTTPDGMFVLALGRLATVPMLDAAQSPMIWTFLDR